MNMFILGRTSALVHLRLIGAWHAWEKVYTRLTLLSGRNVLRRLAILEACVLVAGATVGVISGADRAVRQTSATSLDVSFHSKALAGRLHFLIHLPRGYATSGLRYPVVYFLHGLPAGPTSYHGVSWVGRALDQTGRQAILIVPQGVRRVNGDPEYHDWGPGNDWETALAVDLPAYVDAHFRTIASRNGRAITGVSAGGYGASMIGLHHPAKFAVIESWSGYFHATDPSGKKALDVGSDAANRYASVTALVPTLKHQFRRYPTLFAFYVGRSDPIFVAENVALDHDLREAHVPHLFRLYPGGHSSSVWKAHAVRWLELALDRLSPPSAN
jgi:enterochelin esterase-like enzyme